MEKVVVGVCDDDSIALGAVVGCVEQAFGKAGVQSEIKVFSTAKALLEEMRTTQFSLLLLDIDMEDIDGIELATRIRKNKDPVSIIFVSNCENRVFASFDVEPIGFVRKSHFFADMQKYLAIFLQRSKKKRKTLTVRSEGAIVNIPLEEIVYIEGALANQHIHVRGGADYTLRSSMKELERMLEEYGFLRIHSGYLVNAVFISVFRTSEVQMEDGTVLPLARSKSKEVKEKFLKIMRANGQVGF